MLAATGQGICDTILTIPLVLPPTVVGYFILVWLSESKHGIIAGTVIAFARGLGEYGATSMVAGYIPGKTSTISTSVAYFWQINQDDMALYWVIINLTVSVVFMILINLFHKPNIRG